MKGGTPLRRRRAAKYLTGGLDVCYLCGYNLPDVIHHTSYFPEKTVAVCESCHGYIHSGSDTGLEPDEPRPDSYEKIRRRQEKNEKYHSQAWHTKARLRLDSGGAPPRDEDDPSNYEEVDSL